MPHKSKGFSVNIDIIVVFKVFNDDIKEMKHGHHSEKWGAANVAK